MTCCRYDLFVIDQSYLSVAVVSVYLCMALLFYVTCDAFLFAKLELMTVTMLKIIYYMLLLDMFLI